MTVILFLRACRVAWWWSPVRAQHCAVSVLQLRAENYTDASTSLNRGTRHVPPLHPGTRWYGLTSCSWWCAGQQGGRPLPLQPYLGVGGKGRYVSYTLDGGKEWTEKAQPITWGKLDRTISLSFCAVTANRCAETNQEEMWFKLLYLNHSYCD